MSRDRRESAIETQTLDDTHTTSMQTLHALEDSQEAIHCQTDPVESDGALVPIEVQTTEYTQAAECQTLRGYSSSSLTGDSSSMLSGSSHASLPPDPPPPKSPTSPPKRAPELNRSPSPTIARPRPESGKESSTPVKEPTQVADTDGGMSEHTQVVLVPSIPTVRQNFNGPCARILGIIQIICGLVAIGCQAALTIVESAAIYGGTGFWCGIFFILAGSFGYVAGNRKTGCQIATYLVLSSIAAVFSSGIFISNGIALSIDQTDLEPRSYWTVAVAFHIIMLLDGVVAMVTLIYGAVLCCRVLCASPSIQTVIPIPYKFASNQTVLLMPPGCPEGAVPIVQYATPYPGSQYSSHTGLVGGPIPKIPPPPAKGLKNPLSSADPQVGDYSRLYEFEPPKD